MGAPVIVAAGLGKQYRIGRYRSPYTTLRETLYGGAADLARTVRSRIRGGGTEPPSVWALRDLSFQVERGEALGVIGSNGAGKSTLLKILSRITEPTVGAAAVRGTLGALLEVGTGFHAELTGRENVFLSGAVLGMRRRDIAARFDEIVDFAGVAPFIDTAVKHYSSGMYLRLAFAVAAHLDPDILIVDEVLAVGDAEFQRKCLGKMDSVAGEGRTVVFVSHDLEAVRRLCTRCFLLENGTLARDGRPDQVIDAYLSRVRDRSAPNARIDLGAAERSGSGRVRFLSATYGRDDGDPAGLPRVGGPLAMDLRLEADRDRTLGSLAVYLTSSNGLRLISGDTADQGSPVTLRQGPNPVRVRFEAVHLAPGVYTVGLVASSRAGEVFDHLRAAFHVELVAGEAAPASATAGLVPCRFEVLT